MFLSLLPNKPVVKGSMSPNKQALERVTKFVGRKEADRVGS